MKAGAAVRGVVPGTYVRLLFDYLQARGIDARKLLGEAPPEAGDRGLVRYPAERWRTLLETAATHLRDSLLGLHLGQTITPAHFGVMGYVLLACPNLAAALARLERYQRLVYDVNPLRQRVDGHSVTLLWGVEHGRPGPLVDECAIAALIQFARQITGQTAAPQEIGFVNPQPTDLRPYTRYFGCPVHFDQPETLIRFPPRALQLKLRQPDAALVQVLEHQADALLAELPDSDDFEQAIRRSVTRLAREGEPSLERVADELHLAPRTLRRRLEARGQAFRELRDDTLRRMAEAYLADPRLTLAEIAQLLGYSEQSAFSRSFSRWVGRSPGAYRRGLRQ